MSVLLSASVPPLPLTLPISLVPLMKNILYPTEGGVHDTWRSMET